MLNIGADKLVGQDTILVSVGLPTRNRAHLLPIALNSLLNQTYRNIEFIVSDNASDDETEKIMLEYVTRDPRVQYTRQAQNIGGNPNHEYVLDKARGVYFMWASDDDSWDPLFVETLVDVLEKNHDYGVAMSHYYQQAIHGGEDKMTVRTHYFTNASYQDLFWHYLRNGKSPIFFFGLYRTDALKRILKRHFKVTARGPHLFLCEVALSMKMYSVEKILHTRLQDMRSNLERHPDHPHTKAEYRPLAGTNFLFTTLLWLLTSTVIPLRRKYSMVKLWSRRVWLKKRKIISEFRNYFKSLFPKS
ncbi:MAG: hypothetical protein A2836_02240 [Candidatus Taylorbacteria bacterium RIFCSPHIGHO2_01_FULL_45_63]|uniref:Glycosyltransferase 2-like domain-containing protein n=1 Tax=Candidatus Taylorbacteria bacterium RIFCSPHIGHO2_02_FULL_45_35 TaxID=1802311 RepID=A0A1G2MT42_9BACT|nr:MAG: hypothetical protein A2836_02240 [Candidatus Taylorbacteria bacterium RIFCSPHIGHO2_01_FULL_45_63]OHA26161.1 MAG: hypothetical protein A3D56_00470 [Candidatus Taylorbacteria bacterium RIFCSPHIGHO2_02_FULL_45_35]OHA32509.1 MAG: hypothetical protein A3A22_00670 [Candidatus Taylorbacteria bacterium RIFCSPLOWO2_01_FULL_45_34b]